MRVGIEEGRRFIEDCFRAVGHDANDAGTAAGQVIDIELRGAHFGGFSRALSICNLIREPGRVRSPIAITKETPVSVMVDGGNNCGYVVAPRATRLAIAKARSQGIGIAGARNTYFTGQFSYYVEMATAEGLVGMAFGSSGARVAPFGSSEGRFGTNPIAFGFPADGEPVIIDIGTSSVMIGDLSLWERVGRQLEPGIGFDRDGKPTLDPAVAREGAISVWGGHKGSALAIAVQLFGLMVGSTSPRDNEDCGYLFCAIDPTLFGDSAAFTQAVRSYADSISSARPVDPETPPRVPFSRSAAERRMQIDRGWFEVPDVIVRQLETIAGRPMAARR